MMKTWSGLVILLFVSATILTAQGPPRRGRSGTDKLVAASVNRMLELDADKNGELSKAEVFDPRLASLFARADSDHDDILTKDELTALFKREAEELRPFRGRADNLAPSAVRAARLSRDNLSRAY